MREPTREELKDWAEVFNAPERIERIKREDAELRAKYYRLLGNALSAQSPFPYMGMGYGLGLSGTLFCPSCGHPTYNHGCNTLSGSLGGVFSGIFG